MEHALKLNLTDVTNVFVEGSEHKRKTYLGIFQAGSGYK